PDGSQLVTHGVSEGAFRVWDLRLIRRHLKAIGLDWDLPSYAAPPPEPAGALRVRVVKAAKPAPSAELDAQAHLDRGLLGVRLRRYAAAADDFKRADRLAPQRISWDEVAHAYSEVMERHSEDAEAYHQRAHALGRLGQWDKAVADYTRAISLAPQSPDLLACRGRAYRQLGQTDKAAEDFRKAGEQKAELANRLAWELVT